MKWFVWFWIDDTDAVKVEAISPEEAVRKAQALAAERYPGLTCGGFVPKQIVKGLYP